MDATTRAGVIGPSMRAASPSISAARVAFMDNLRYLMVVLVVVYHAVAAYAIVAPHWAYHDTSSLTADIIRELFDVFMMPVLFFAAGYFALVSLEKKGTWAFLKDKVSRLLFPWVLAVFIFTPLLLYDQPATTVHPFRSYWLWYLSQFAVRLRPSEAPVAATSQLIYWFISLLFAFFLVLALVDALRQRLRGAQARPTARKADSSRAILVALVAFGLLLTVTHFALLLFVPDSSWFTLHALLEFQVTRLIPYAGCFALGIYAQSRGWFEGGRAPGSLTVWGALSVVLVATFLVFGQPMFVDTGGAAHFAAGYLLAFAFLRSFLLVALLVTFVSFGIRYWNRASRLDQQLAATSYNIYLVHFFIVVALQAALINWVGGPVAIKIAIDFLAALVLSYAISRWILARHARVFALVLLALFVFCLVVRP